MAPQTQDRRPTGRQQPAELNRQMPYDLDAEQAVLGSIVLMPDVLDDLGTMLEPADFFDTAHQTLYAELRAIYDGGGRIDPTLLVNRLKTAGQFEAVGGAAYLYKIFESVPNAAHAVYYGRIVREAANLRNLIQAGTEIVRDAYEQTTPSGEQIVEAEKRVMGVADRQSALDHSVRGVREVLIEAMDRIEQRMQGLGDLGMQTGIRAVDDVVGGLRPGELTILAARPSQGKSALAVGIAAENAVRQQKTVLFVTQEMLSIELADRVLSAEAQVNLFNIRNGRLRQDELSRIVAASGRISEAKLLLDDQLVNAEQVASVARRVRRKAGGLDLLIVDYLQLMPPIDGRDNREQQVAKNSRTLKRLAQELKIPVLCLAQLNREADNQGVRPRLSHLRESGSIEQDADVVWFVWRPYEQSAMNLESGETPGVEILEDGTHAEEAKIIVAKHRNGPCGEADVHWLKQTARFVDRRVNSDVSDEWYPSGPDAAAGERGDEF